MESVGPKGVGVKELRVSLQQVSRELKEVLAENHRLNQMVLSSQNVVDFSCSQLEEVQRENDKLWSQIHRLEWGYNATEIELDITSLLSHF